MKAPNRALFLAAGITAAGLARAQAPEPPPPSQTSTARIKTPVKNFAVETSADYLGSVDGKTVVRLQLTSAEIAKALVGKGIKQY